MGAGAGGAGQAVVEWVQVVARQQGPNFLPLLRVVFGGDLKGLALRAVHGSTRQDDGGRVKEEEEDPLAALPPLPLLRLLVGGARDGEERKRLLTRLRGSLLGWPRCAPPTPSIRQPVRFVTLPSLLHSVVS